MKTLIKISSILLFYTFISSTNINAQDHIFYESTWMSYGLTLNEDVDVYIKTCLEGKPIQYTHFHWNNTTNGVGYPEVKYYGDEWDEGYIEAYIVGETKTTSWKRKNFPYAAGGYGVSFSEDDWVPKDDFME